jgi:hypothetical protein
MSQCLYLLVSVCLSLATPTLFAKNGEFSEHRALPPLKLSAADLDAVLHKTQAFIASVNGSAGDQESARESVTLGVRGHEIEIPHFSLASSVAFPREIFKFSYTYNRPDRPISFVTIDLGDYSRRVSVTGEAEDQVRATSNLIEKDLLRFSTTVGGASFRRLAGSVPRRGIAGLPWPKRRLVVAYSTLQRIGYADLFGCWPVARVSPAVGQILSGVCSLPELFSFPSHQICASDFFSHPCRSSPRNSTIVFSSSLATEA